MELIENERISQGLSEALLCKISGVSKSNYYNYLDGSEPPFKAIDKLIRGLGFELMPVKVLT